MRPFPLLWALLAVLLACARASADGLDREDEISLRLGGYGSGTQIQINGKEDVGDGGGFIGLRYLYNVDPMIGFGVDLNGMNAGTHDSSTLITNSVSRTALGTGELLAILRARFGHEHFRPYLLGGLGLETTRLKVDARPQNGFVWTDTGTAENRTLVDDAEHGLGVEFEGGFDYHFNPTLSAGAFLGLHFASKQTYGPTSAGRAFGLSGIEGGFGGAALGASLTGRF